MNTKAILIRPIYDGKYFISSDGHVYSKIGTSVREISSQVSHKGYEIVTLYLNNKRKNARVHRLVAETYVPNPQRLR